MDIRNRKELKEFAAQRLDHTREDKKLVLIYAAVVIGLSILVTVVNHVLGLQIDQTGGLSNMGTRTVLSALQTMLPVVQSLVVMCVQLGYVAAMLRIARGQYVSVKTLRLGFDRFWVLLRYTLLQNLIFTGLGFSCLYIAIMVFAMTPLSRPIMELLTPLVSQTTLLDSTLTIPDALYDQLMNAMLPVFLLWSLLFGIVGIPVFYRLRMTSYVLIDKPGMGALAAMQESKRMMRKNAVNLFKLDLSIWWYYAATIVASVVCYGDVILVNLGVELPFSADVAFYVFYALYWVAQFAIFYFLRNPLEVTYALAYDSLRPKEQDNGGVVLGNIFQM